MSSIALVAGDTTHPTTNATASHLTGLGHTVSTFDNTSLATPGTFDGFDFICTLRLVPSDSLADGSAIRSLLTYGKPLLLGLMVAGLGAPVSHPYTEAGILGAVEVLGGSDSGYLISNTAHPITSAYSFGQNVEAQTNTFGASLMIASATEFSGTKLADNEVSGRGNFFAIDRGDLTIDGVTTITERVVIAEHIYGASGYTVPGQVLTQSIIDWLLEPPPPPSGVTLGQRWPRAVTGAAPTLRQEAVYTTASLASLASEQGSLEMSASYRLIRIATSGPARVRLYASAAYQAADEARPIGTDPTGDHGLLFEFVTTTGALTSFISPLVDGASDDGTTSIPITVTNRDASAASVEVTFEYLRTE